MAYGPRAAVELASVAYDRGFAAGQRGGRAAAQTNGNRIMTELACAQIASAIDALLVHSECLSPADRITLSEAHRCAMRIAGTEAGA